MDQGQAARHEPANALGERAPWANASTRRRRKAERQALRETEIVFGQGRKRRNRPVFALSGGWVGAALWACALINLGTVAWAQEPESDAAGPNGAGSTNPADLTRFDPLNAHGWNIPHPSVADTLVGDAGGVRSTLADVGIGFFGQSINIFEYDLTQSNRGKPIAVNGQVGTWNNAYQYLSTTYDIGRFGLEGGQLNVSGWLIADSLQKVNIPDVTRIGDISYNQQLAGGKIDLQVGYSSSEDYFVGVEVGGSLAAGVLGPQAVIPFEVGLSYPPFATPLAWIKADLGGGFYDRAGAQRSLPPGGGLIEARINPGAGLKFAPEGTSALFIDELGYQKAPAAGQSSIWIRAGGIYNTTQFKSFASGRDVENWALYVLADRQLTSIDPAQPIRGLYIGASAMYAPPEQNLFSQYYELRTYVFGPFDARPTDFASIVVSYETYSKEGQEALAPPSFGAFAQTMTAIGNYAFHVRPGLYVQPGLGWTTHASVSRQYSASFDSYLGLTAFF